MLRLSIWIGLLTLFATISAKHHHMHHREPLEWTGRFGFDFWKPSQLFCHLCMSAGTARTMNLICSMKCHELYFPHGTTSPASPTPASTTSGATAESATTIPPIATTNTMAPSSATMGPVMTNTMPSAAPPASSMTGG